MDWPRRPVRRWPWVAAIVLLGLVAVIWAILPDGRAGRVERYADCFRPADVPPVETLADGRKAMRLRALLWNVEGLPWPIRSGREAKLKQIADWVAKRRAAGLGPDILILHKAFTPDASRIAVAAGYRSIIPGPARDQARTHRAVALPGGFAEGARWSKGEGVGKWLDGGLYIATDLPLRAWQSDPFSTDTCAGFDCLANKGEMLVKVAIPGAPLPLYLFNTHRNSREPSGVSIARAEQAHVAQTLENDQMLYEWVHVNVPIIAAGDFNNYRAGDRVGAFARDHFFRLAAKGDGYRARPALINDQSAWQGATDLVGYSSFDALRVEALAVATLFDGKNGPRLSDHDAQYIVFRLSWPAEAPATKNPVPLCAA